MKNRKGFTLVEILAMLVILGILMAVAIPNISGILNNNRKNAYKSDATRMVDTAKMKVAKGNVKKPAKNKCVVLALKYLNDSDDIVKGPNGGLYLEYESFVIIKRIDNKYEYYVRLVEDAPGGNYGINMDTIPNINKEDSTSIDTVNTVYGFTGAETAANMSIPGYCAVGDVSYYYK